MGDDARHRVNRLKILLAAAASVLSSATVKNQLSRGFALLPVLLAPMASGAISIQSFSPATNDRFANDPSFIGDAYDWSGVGRSAGGQWVVMLTPTVFLTAQHAPASGTITFFPGNDPGASAVTRTVSTGQQISGTDLRIGQLDSALPPTIATYNFATTALTSTTFSTSFLANAPVFLSGHSPTTTGYGGSALTNQAVGTNRVEGFVAGQSIAGSPTDVLVTVQNQPGDVGYTHTTYEAQLASGDSGGPLMWVSGGDLVVVGINAAVGTVDIQPGPGETLRPASVFSYTGNYAGPIQDYINAAMIPEPSVIGLLASATALLLRRRR